MPADQGPVLSTRDLIVPYEGALSAEVCEEIIARFERDTRQYKSRTADGLGTGRQGTMVNMGAAPHWADLKQAVTETITACLHEYVGRYQSLNLILRHEKVFLSSPIIERMEPGQGFPWHIDSGPRKTADRFLSALSYLNDVADGGCTEFPLQGLNLEPKAGTIVFFPPYWLYPHRGAAPTRARKYKMTAYFTIGRG